MEVVSYTLILCLQIVLILYDIIINSVIDLINPANVIQLVLFVIQDICLVFQLIVLFLELFNTSIFQSGFVTYMLRKFRASIIIALIYLGLSIGLHVWTLTQRWNDTSTFVWGVGGYYVLYVIQRGFSPFHYYYYKRAALRLGDSMFYRNADWLKNQQSPR